MTKCLVHCGFSGMQVCPKNAIIDFLKQFNDTPFTNILEELQKTKSEFI